MMTLLHLGRLLGMVALMGALLPAVLAFADQRPAQMLLAGSCMLAGLLVAVVCDLALDAALERNAGSDGEALQKHVTETVWGSVWTRDGLARRDRSLLPCQP